MVGQPQDSVQNKPMKAIKGITRKLISPEFYDFLRSGRNSLLSILGWPSVYFHPWWQESARRLVEYQDRYAGKRCFVIGNGPSLKNMDLSLLKDEHTFGMNRVYLAFNDWGFNTNFLVSVNDLVIEQCSQEFQNLDMPKFYSWRSKDLLLGDGTPDDQTHFLYSTYTGKKFARKTIDRFWEGATVTYVCLQLAYCMGFSEVILIGVDHNFVSKGKASLTVVSNGDDPNHFSPDYFGKGFRWQLPDLDLSEIAYRLANKVYKDAGRRVIDATVDGKLNVFPKADYLSLLN